MDYEAYHKCVWGTSTPTYEHKPGFGVDIGKRKKGKTTSHKRISKLQIRLTLSTCSAAAHSAFLVLLMGANATTEMHSYWKLSGFFF